jgi:receptor protein-tyrosine kinase
MNADPSTSLPDIPDEIIRQALVHLFRLSRDAVEGIQVVMDARTISFGEAAVETRAVTQQELDEALEWIRSQPIKQRRSIVEEVLRRHVRHSRELILWEGTPLRPSKELTLGHDPGHPRAETLRSLRTELVLRMKGRSTRTLAVLSPSAGEGRSRLAAEMAISFAQLGRKTLLVDADLRRPRQHILFEAENATGLAQALQDGGALRLHGIDKLPQMALATSGPVPPNPLELLSSPHFERLVREWRRSFEFVVLDTPPVAEFSDAIAVATIAEQVLILGRTDQTSFDSVKEMRRKLGTTGAQILGAVLGRF